MEHLQQAFNFTDDDLAANQAGHTSHAQRRRLFWRYTSIVWGGFGLFNLAFVLTPSILIASDDFWVGLGRVARGFSLPTGILSLVLFIYNTYHLHYSRQHLAKGCGMILIESVPIKQTFRHSLYLNNNELSRLTDKQFEALHSGQYYCFYTLPLGSQIVSVIPISPPEPLDDDDDPENPFPLINNDNALENSFPSIDRALGLALNFTAADLAQNQAGILTPSQAKRLFLEAANESISWITGVGSLLCLFLCLSFVPAEDKETLPWAILFLLGVMSPGVIGLVNQWGKARQDRQKQQVEKMTGRIVCEKMDGISLTPYLCLRLGTHRFKVSGKVVNAVENNTRYTLYYAPTTKVLVAIEKVPEGEKLP